MLSFVLSEVKSLAKTVSLIINIFEFIISNFDLPSLLYLFLTTAGAMRVKTKTLYDDKQIGVHTLCMASLLHLAIVKSERVFLKIKINLSSLTSIASSIMLCTSP